MNIAFILPGITKKIIGGYKIVYEYANRLYEYGYNIHIIYDCSSDRKVNKNILPGIICYRKLLKLSEPKWFPINKKIKKNVCFKLKQNFFFDDDIIIATSVITAMDLNKLGLEGKKLFYFIQGFENWEVPNLELMQTYSYPMKKIAVSRWLQNIIMKGNDFCEYLPNSIDSHKFYLINCLVYNKSTKSCRQNSQSCIGKFPKIA